MPDMDLLLRGTIITPAATLQGGWIAVSGGRIAAVGPGPDAPAAARTIDHGDGLKCSPFHGDSFSLRVAATYLRGAPVWDGADILNTPGSGRYVARGATGWFADQGHDQ